MQRDSQSHKDFLTVRRIIINRIDLTSAAIDKLNKMGLNVFLSGRDYQGGKPDLVVVYPDKNKYYLTEIVSDDCLSKPGARVGGERSDMKSRAFCARHFPDARKSAWAAAIYCDLGQGVELFEYKELKGMKLYEMQRYAALIYPAAVSAEADNFLRNIHLQYRSLDVLGIFTLTLFSQTDSVKLGESRRFMQFLMANQQEEI